MSYTVDYDCASGHKLKVMTQITDTNIIITSSRDYFEIK